jgi:hypothetical protein
VCLRGQIIHAPLAITEVVCYFEIRHDAQCLGNGEAKGKPDNVLCWTCHGIP